MIVNLVQFKYGFVRNSITRVIALGKYNKSVIRSECTCFRSQQTFLGLRFVHGILKLDVNSSVEIETIIGTSSYVSLVLIQHNQLSTNTANNKTTFPLRPSCYC